MTPLARFFDNEWTPWHSAHILDAISSRSDILEILEFNFNVVDVTVVFSANTVTVHDILDDKKETIPLHDFLARLENQPKVSS